MMDKSISVLRAAASSARRVFGAAALAVLALTLGSCPNAIQSPLLAEVQRLVEEGTGTARYTILYEANGASSGSVPVDSNTYTTGQVVSVLGNTGLLSNGTLFFNGWNTKADGTGTRYTADQTFLMPARDVTLYALWVAAYSVTYHPNDATGGSAPLDPTGYIPDQLVSVKNNEGSLTKSGFSFGGWNTEPDGAGIDRDPGSTFEIEESVTLYAKWICTVTYNSNGGAGSMSPQQIVDGQTANLLQNVFTRSNHSFEGWAGSPGGPILYLDQATYPGSNGNFELFAVWNPGVDWTAQTNSNGTTYWKAIVSSGDGNKLCAADSNYIYTSTDGGVNWTQSPLFSNLQTVATSADGTKLVAVQKTSTNRALFTSSDSGATWVERTGAGKRRWQALASSGDGTKLAAAVNPDTCSIYTSTDSGETWTVRTNAGTRNWQTIASSSDGTKLAAAVETGYIYTSADGGATWTERTGAGSRVWMAITSSADGTKLAAATDGGYIYTSTDGGATWTERTGAGNGAWRSIASSADGKMLAVAAFSGNIYTSPDGGGHWAQRTGAGTRSWVSVAMSGDGQKFFAAAEGAHIHTSP